MACISCMLIYAYKPISEWRRAIAVQGLTLYLSMDKLK